MGPLHLKDLAALAMRRDVSETLRYVTLRYGDLTLHCRWNDFLSINKDHQRMMVDSMLMIVKNSRLFLIDVKPTAKLSNFPSIHTYV